MSNLSETWSKSTTAIFNGVLLYSLGGILHPIFNFINSTASTVNTLSSFAQGNFSSGGPSALSIICKILIAAIILGYYLYLKGLSDFAKILDSTDSTAVGTIRSATIVILIGWVLSFVFGFLPFVGFVGRLISGILCLIAYIMMLQGYSTLKKSSTFPEQARKGASSLFTAIVLLLCAIIIGLIPLIGGIPSMILNIIAFIMVLSGWAKIKNAVANPTTTMNNQ
ncbi:MAG: hypothetical protein LBC84_07205 [Prevotellaceae bacterium]|jgi:uncharacterized membrane protein SirB2|nr:hypothetical protein [Prevotellaceae bacterium]